MFIIFAQLMDGAGVEIEARDVTGHTLPLTMTAAQVWGRGALERTSDPDAYVQYTATESKPKIGLVEFLDAATPAP